MEKIIQGDSVIGLDEVGRGALAGPVVVVAAMVRNVSCAVCRDGTLKDSKKLSARQREAWHAHFKDHPGISSAIARAYPRVIEKRNISKAANAAALRAYLRLMVKSKGLVANLPIFLDGGLYLGKRRSQKINHPHAVTMPKADETIPAVAIASIIAKVHRDDYMCRLGKKYPSYGFAMHKGYGTKTHYAAIKKYGQCPAHRKTFLSVDF